MFLDTANAEEIDMALQSGIFQGVTTNPSLLVKEGMARTKKVTEIFERDVPMLFVQAIGSTYEELFAEAQTIYALAPEGKTIGVKVPLNQAGLRVITEIKKQHPSQLVLGTAIYSAEQAILGALAGCDYLAPYVNRMTTHGLNPFEAIELTRAFIEDRGLHSKIMAASFKTPQQVTQALAAGAHTATIPYDIYLQMINREVALSAIAVFNEHGSQLQTAGE